MDADTRRILVHALGAVLTVGLLGGLAACAATKPEVTPSAEDAAPAVTVRAYDCQSVFTRSRKDWEVPAGVV